MAESQRRPLEVGSIYCMNHDQYIEIIEYVNKSKVLVEFKDEFKHRRWVEKSQIKNRSVRNPFRKTLFGRGYIGEGIYSTKNDGVDTKEYVCWSGIFWRCYDENRLKRNPTYTGCSVSESWYNFQSFCEWYCSRSQYSLNWQVDKDLLIPENKIYSEKACCLLPAEINSFLANKALKSDGLPPGVHWAAKEGKYKAQIKDQFAENQRLLGMSSDPNKVFKLYKEAKENQAVFLAEKWKDLLDINAYEKLKQYTVEWRK